MLTDQLSEQAHIKTDQAAKSAQTAIQSTQKLANAAVDGLSDASRHLRTSVMHSSESTAQYIRDKPIQAVLIAAAAGAAFTALVSIVTRSRARE